MSASTSPPPPPTSISTSTNTHPTLLDPQHFPQSLSSADNNIHVTLTHSPLNPTTILSTVRSPTAGANVLFLGTTRNTFAARPVTTLAYSAYPALALKSLLQIAEHVRTTHGLVRVCLVHRLGEVPVGEESIAVCVSAGHRGPAWRGAEEALEMCKERVEVWKMEVFGDGQGEGEVEGGRGVWRANRDRDRDGKLV